MICTRFYALSYAVEKKALGREFHAESRLESIVINGKHATATHMIGRYRGLRSQLMQGGRQSSRWILEKFIKAPAVVVSGEDHFAEILGTWGDDPCNKATRQR